ncbi:hypothetical protein V1506DRAFT_546951 [Lipomyces tetrasporus]
MKTEEAHEKINALQTKLVQTESTRRILHNQVMELKGNIRVFCRVRPLQMDELLDVADIHYPDESTEGQKIVWSVQNESAMGTVITKPHDFEFDGAQSHNAEINDAISLLVKSALDGYNVTD